MYSADRAVYLIGCEVDQRNIWIILNFLVAFGDNGLFTGPNGKCIDFIQIGSLSV